MKEGRKDADGGRTEGSKDIKAGRKEGRKEGRHIQARVGMKSASNG